MDNSYADFEREYSDEATTYYRVEPPPKYLFEEERLKATVHFSSAGSEFVGSGHWSKVFRVRMEHDDFTCELKKKKEKKSDEMDVDIDVVSLFFRYEFLVGF